MNLEPEIAIKLATLRPKLSDLNETVWATIAPSTIHGVGVFAIRDIPSGTKLTDCEIFGDFNRQLYTVSSDELDKLHPAIRHLILQRHLFSTERLVFYSPNTVFDLQSLMNHSVTPNSDGRFALRDIAAGEEITEDYRQLVKEIHPVSAAYNRQLLN